MKKFPEITLRRFVLKVAIVRRSRVGDPETFKVTGTADVLYASWGLIRHVTSLKKKRTAAPFLLTDSKKIA